MARVDRFSYKQAAKAKASARFKELIVVFLLAIFGILVSVTVNAQKTSDVNAQSKSVSKKKSTSPYKSRASLNKKATRQQVAAAELKPEEYISFGLMPSTNLQATLIKEMVAAHLTENQKGSIELAPLYLTYSENRLIATDANPLLIAVEFGLQGKTILIGELQTEAITDNLSFALFEEIKNVMQKMGVPENRISIQHGYKLALSENMNEQRLNVNRRVDFKAI